MCCLEEGSCREVGMIVVGVMVMVVEVQVVVVVVLRMVVSILVVVKEAYEEVIAPTTWGCH